jgi:hypothetical protein
MAIPARLSRSLHHRLGDKASEDLINWMGQMEANRSELRNMMEGYVARTNSRFAENEARMDAGFAVLKGELLASIERGRADAIKWSFVFWCGTMAIVIGARLIG